MTLETWRVVGLAIGLAACGARPTLEPGIDAGHDGGPPPAMDAGRSDSGFVDAGSTDAGKDGGTDAGARDAGEVEFGDVSGRWAGTVTASGGAFVVGGTHAVLVDLVQDGTVVRGVVDVASDAGVLAEWVGHLVDGARRGNGLELQMTDRLCGAGDPVGLCMPRPSQYKEAVFDLRLELTERGAESVQLAPHAGVAYPPMIPLEVPFDALQATQASAPVASDAGLDGTWRGALNLPRSGIYAGPILFGESQVTFQQGTLVKWEIFRGSELGWLEMWPADPQLLWGNTFRFDPSSGRFWMQQAGAGGPMLWVGQLRGDAIVGVFGSDPVDGGYSPTAPPGDFSVIPLLDFEGTFFWVRQ